VAQAGQIFQGLLSARVDAWPADQLPWPALVVMALALWVLSPWAQALENGAIRLLRAFGMVGTTLLMAVVLALVIFWGPEGVPSFIYYRF
jgi:hypothetical protein